MAAPLVCSKNLLWKRIYVLFKQNPSKCKMLLVAKMVVFGRSVSCSNLALITSNADATEIDVKSEVTSN